MYKQMYTVHPPDLLLLITCCCICLELAELLKPERESSNVMEGRDGDRREGELEDRSDEAEEMEEGELEDNSEEMEEGDRDGVWNDDPSADDCCCCMLLLLLKPFRCINSINRLRSFSDSCCPVLV